ncbi:hypothetical protein Tco_1246051 [Tanacetum coccineum]
MSYNDLKYEVLYVGPFEILERLGLVAYRLRLAEELNSVHDTFHVSNLKKFLADANLHVPLDEIKVDKTLHFVEEPVEIMDREIKKLKRRKLALVKVRWNSKRGPEFTWEHEDQMRINQLSANDKTGFGHNGVKESKVSETITSVSKVETSNDKVEMPRIKAIRMSEPIIKEWESDSEDDEIVVKPEEVTKTIKPSFEKIEYVNAKNKTVRQAENHRKNNKSPRGNKRN